MYVFCVFPDQSRSPPADLCRAKKSSCKNPYPAPLISDRMDGYLWHFTNDDKTQFWSVGTSQCYFSYECKNEFMPPRLINNTGANITLPEKLPNDIFARHSILASGVIDARANYYHSRPKYPYHIMLVVLDGTLLYRTESQKGGADKGTIITIPAGSIFEESVRKKCRVLWLHLRPSPEWNGAFGKKIGFSHSRNIADIEAVMDIMKREIYAEKRSILFLNNVVAVFAELIKREFFETGNDPLETYLEKTAMEICNNPQEDWRRSTVAKALNVGEWDIDNHFKKRHSKTFAKFVLSARMETAAKLLAKNSLTNTEIAKRTGYADRSSLSKAFKKYYGKSLKNYPDILAGKAQ